MLKILIKNQAHALFDRFMSGQGRTTGTKLAYFFLLLLALATFPLLFSTYFAQLCGPFHQMGIDWLYFSFVGITAFALAFIGSVFSAQSLLYEAKDNELLLSLPIPPRMVLLSRMLLLWGITLVLGLAAALPAGIVYARAAPFSAGQIVLFLLQFLLLSLFSLALSCALGWILTIISARVRRKSLVITLLSLAALGAYFYAFSQINGFLSQLLLAGTAIAQSVRGAAAPLYWFGSAIAQGSVLDFLRTAALILPFFLLVLLLLSRSFLKLATTKRGFQKMRYLEKSVRAASAERALLRKELRSFAASPGYMLNAGLGLIFTLAFSVFLLVKRDFLIPLLAPTGMAEKLPTLAALALCLLNAMDLISAPALSLEGKNLWILQSLPLSTRDILLSKLRPHLLLCLPVGAVASLSCIFVLRPTPAEAIFLLLLPAGMTLFCALFGVFCNLHFPRFDWINQTQTVKQSRSVVFAMLGSTVVSLLPALLFFALSPPPILFLALDTLFLAALSLALYRWLMGRGAQIFEEL